jgi:acyl-CoA thioester hydrolase
MPTYIYELPFKVRDYECDLQGIVNNAVYQNYLEHTRHEFALQEGISFSDMHARGIDAVVSRVDIRYKNSLRSEDEFLSKLYIKKEGIRYVFYQDIYRKADNALCIKAQIEVVCIDNGKLTANCEEMDEVFNIWSKE